MSSSTADALGLSRAILCNDTLVKKLQELQDTEFTYKGLVEHCKRVLQAHMELLQAVKAMGDIFSNLAVREPQPRASEAFRLFGEQHRNMEKLGLQDLQDTEFTYLGLVEHCKRVLQAHVETLQAVKAMGDVFSNLAVRESRPRASEAFRLFGEQHRNMEKLGHGMIKEVRPVLADMGTYLHKAIPDTRLTVKKYADAKFEYLAYCLKAKEMDDATKSAVMLPYRNHYIGCKPEITNTGIVPHRLILRCRQVARARSAKLRADVLIKMELLKNKHVQSLGGHLAKLIRGLSELHTNTLPLLSGPHLFPVEVDLSNSAFQYKSTTPIVADAEEEEQEIENGVEVTEAQENDLIPDLTVNLDEDILKEVKMHLLIPGIEAVQQEPDYNSMDTLTLLSTLNLNESPKHSPLNSYESPKSTSIELLLPDL